MHFAATAVAVSTCVLLAFGQDQAIPIPRPKPPAPPASTKKTAAPPSAVKLSAAVLIETDADCKLVVDGAEPVELKANDTKRVAVPVGEHAIRAESTEDSQVFWRKVIEVRGAEQKAVLIELQPMLAKKRELAAAERAKAAAERDRAEEASALRAKQNAQEAAERELAQFIGLWEGDKESDGKFAPEKKIPYHAKVHYSLNVERSGAGLVGVFYWRTQFTSPDKDSNFSRETTSRLQLRYAGNKLTGTGSGSKVKDSNQPDWEEIAEPAFFEASFNGNLQFNFIAKKGINNIRGTLTRH